MKITVVKKIKADGSPCRKCADVEKRLRESGYMDRIDEIVVADERDPDSAGMRLARDFNVELAPFLIVEDDPGSPRIYTVYFRLVKEVLQGTSTEAEEIAEIMDRNPDIDYI